MTEAPTSSDSANTRHRHQRLRWAVATSGASKLTGFAVQLVLLPLVLHAVGRDRYAAFLALTSLLAWIGLLGFGLLPTLAQSLASLTTAQNRRGERDLILTALGFAGMIGIALAAVAAVGGGLVDIRPIIGAEKLPSGDIRAAFLVSVAIVALMFVGSVAGAIRAGFQEVHVTNFWSLGANFVSLGAGLWAAVKFPSLVSFVVVIQLPLALASLCDIVLILWRRPYLRGLPTIKTRELSKLLMSSWSVWIVQLTAFANLNLSLLVVARMTGAGPAAGFGSILRLELLLSGVVALIMTPLVPAIASADALGDLRWVRQSARALTGYTVAASVVIGTALAVAGPQLIRLWLGTSLGLSPALCAVLGFYFVLWMMHFAQFNILLGLGETKGLAGCTP